MTGRKRGSASETDAPTGAGTDAPTGAETETEAPALPVFASLTEESEHETITRAERVYVDEMRATDGDGNVYAVQREVRADGSKGAREITRITTRKEGGESRQALRYLSEYGGAARAFRNVGAYLFPRFLDDLTPDEIGALTEAREDESK